MDECPENLLVRAEGAYQLSIAEPVEAAPLAAALVAEARRCGDDESLVVALRAQGWSLRMLLESERAKGLLDEAARVARRAELGVRLGEVLVVRAAVNQELGRARAAHRDLELARPLLGGGALAALEHQTAVLHQNAGRLVEAARIYRRALADPECPTDVRAKACNNLAMIVAEFGNFSEALTLLEQARALGLEVGPAFTAYFAEGHATVMAQAGLLPASLDLFSEAERLYKLAGLPRAELYAEYADAMSDLRLLPEAREAAQRAVEEFGANRVPLMRAEAELRVARVALLAGDLSLAEGAAAAALGIFRQQDRSGWAAWAEVVRVQARLQAATATLDDLHRVRRAAATLERLQMTSAAVDAHLTAGRVAVAQHRDKWGISSLERAGELARKSSMLLRLKGRMAAAQAAVVRGNEQQALRECRAGLADLERHRGALASTELRVRASAHGAELGRLGLRTLIHAGSALDTFGWMERTRAAALVAVEHLPRDGFEEELASLRSLQSEISAAGGGSPEQVARQTALEDRLRRLTWSETAVASDAARSSGVAELRELLGERLLLEYGVLDGEVFVIVVSRRQTRIRHLASIEAVDTEVEKLLFSLRMLSRPMPAAATVGLHRLAHERLARVRAMLVDPLHLPPDQEVVVVPVDVLQRAPWSALHGGPVSVSPSAAFWMKARRRTAPLVGRALLVAGPGLSSAVDEVARLAGLDPDKVVLLPPDSTVAAVAEALRATRLAHFACHGQVRSDNPLFSGLLLSDGLLTVQELELRNIAPHCVVLAACEAAADASYPGGEMLGFVSALLARGTAGIVASIIVVPDATAPNLMVGLHEHVRRGDSLPLALHAARGSLDLQDPRELVNWCGFTAFGAA